MNYIGGVAKVVKAVVHEFGVTKSVIVGASGLTGAFLGIGTASVLVPNSPITSKIVEAVNKNR